MEAWIAYKKIKDNKGRVVSVVIGIIISFTMLIASAYFDWANKTFDKTAEEGETVYNKQGDRDLIKGFDIRISLLDNNLHTYYKTEQRIPLNLIESLREDDRIDEMIISYDCDSEIEWFNRVELFAEPKFIDTNESVFPSAYVKEVTDMNKKPIISGRIFNKGEENAAMVSSLVTEALGITPEEAVGEKIKLRREGKETEALIVGVYDKWLSDQLWNREYSYGIPYTEDLIVSSDALKQINSAMLNTNGTSVLVILKETDDLEGFLYGIRREYGICPQSGTWGLISEQLIMTIWARSMLIMGGLAIIATMLMMASALYRNIYEQRNTWELLECLGMKKTRISRIVLAECIGYGLPGWIIGLLVSFLLTVFIGMLFLYGTPEFQNVTDLFLPIDYYVKASLICWSGILLSGLCFYGMTCYGRKVKE